MLLNFWNSSLNIFSIMCHSKMHDGFKVNESVCIAKFEQQCVITIIKIFENEPKFRWLDEKCFILHLSFVLTHLMIAAS